MRLLHIIDSGDPAGGGPVMGIRSMAAFHEGEGHHVDVLTLDSPDSPWLGDAPGRWHALGGGRGGFAFSSKITIWLREHSSDYDAIIINGLWKFVGLAVWWELCDWFGMRRGSGSHRGCPFYVFPHGMLDPWFKRRYPVKHLKKSFYWRVAEQYVLRDAAAVCFTCEEEKLLARETFRPYRCVERVVGFGIAPPASNESEQVRSFFDMFPALRGEPYLLFLSRLHEKKGVDMLLEAYARLSLEGCGDLPGLVIAGPAVDGYEKTLESLALKLGLNVADGKFVQKKEGQGVVHFLPMLQGDAKWGAFRSCEAFVLPSHQENFGIAVVEALACGKPVLITDKVNIWREIQADNAGIVESDSMTGISRMLRRWLSCSERDRDEMAASALNCFVNHFHIKAAAGALMDVIRENRRTKIHEDNNSSRSLLSSSSH